MSSLSFNKERICETLRLCRRTASNIRKCYDIPLYKVVNCVHSMVSETDESVVPEDDADVDFNQLHCCCAYLISYGACHAELVYKQLKSFLSSNDDIRSNIAASGNLNVTSVGSGPGTDLLGVMYTLYKVIGGTGLKQLNLTSVDSKIGWQVFFSSMMSEVQSFGDFSPLCKFINDVQVLHSFVDASMTDPTVYENEILKTVLRLSDLVIVVKTLSTLECEERWKLLQNVGDLMRSKALLFVVDCQSTFPLSSSIQEKFEVIFDVEEAVVETKSSQVYGCRNGTRSAASAIALKKR